MNEPRGARDLRTSRRIVFQGLGALGVAAALAGCGGSSDAGSGGGGGGGTSGGASDTGSSGGGAVPEAGAKLATVAEIPVGGGIVLPAANLVITQPTAGDFKAFSATCTHAGNQVNAIDGAEIVCPVHGSRFSIKDGSVTNPPASQPLEPIAVKVDGDSIVTA